MQNVDLRNKINCYKLFLVKNESEAAIDFFEFDFSFQLKFFWSPSSSF